MGQQLKCYKNTLQSLGKFLLMIKTIIKHSRKNTTHMVSILCNYFPLRIHCNETVSVSMHANWCNTEVREGVTDQWTHVTMHDVINIICVPWAANLIPMEGTLKLQLGTSTPVYKNVCSVYIFAVCISMVNTNLWLLKCLYIQHTKFPLTYVKVRFQVLL